AFTLRCFIPAISYRRTTGFSPRWRNAPRIWSVRDGAVMTNLGTFAAAAYQTTLSLNATQQIASIVESSDDAIVSKSLDGIIRTWNQGAEQLFGYAAEEIVGKPVTILIPPE